jgi:hypothetical protein
MRKITASVVAALIGNAQAQALGTFAALSAISMEWLHIPFGPVLCSALGGIIALLMLYAPNGPQSRGQSIINILMTLFCVPSAALLGCALAGYLQWDIDSLGTYVICWAMGLTLHKALPTMIDKFGQRLVDGMNKLFDKAGM